MSDRIYVSWIMLGLIVLYLLGLLVIARRLQRRHFAVWTDLGRPSLLNWSIASSFRLFRYVIFQGSYKSLNDSDMNRLITIERLLCAALLATTIAWAAYFSHLS